MKPKVTIIIVNYNGYEDTVECVKSLKNIDYDNYEIVCVDNASTNKATEEQNEYLECNTIYLSSDNNLGFSGGNNIGINYAKKNGSDYVLLLNNDTTVESDFLTKLVAVAREKMDNGVFGCTIRYYWDRDKLWFDGGTFDFDTGNTSHYHDGNGDNIVEVTFLTGCLMLIPMQILEDVGMLDESYFLYAEDTDYCCRVMNAGYQLYYCTDAVIYHKEGATAGRNSNLKQYYVERNGLFICAKYSKHPIRACLRRSYLTWKSVFRGRMNFQPIWYAYIDFIRNRRGRRE